MSNTELHQTGIDAVIAASAPKVMYGGGFAGGYGFLTSNQFLGLMGLLVAVAGFVVNWYYKREENKRQKLEHELRVQALRGDYE